MTSFSAIALCANVVLPLALAALIALLGERHERAISRIAALGSATWAFIALGLVGSLISSGAPLEVALGDLYQTESYRFSLLLYFDSISAAFLTVSAFLGVIVVSYCRYYLHREPGYARFFATIFAFFGGISLLVSAGTLDLLFAGWEVVGLSSYLLIGFYRQRTIAQRNALRAFSVYRLCDVGILMGAWLEHLHWHDVHGFAALASLSPEQLTEPGFWPLLGMTALLLLAAAGKSAQAPFSYWLPRAMEGPTPSSAIFYGALSVHAGVFLLLRTSPLWMEFEPIRWAMGALGATTAVIASLSGRTQPNIKGQIGYASIAQVGIMFVELALGLHTLALFHFAANATLRCYQLLVSPSVVAHLLQIQAASPGALRFYGAPLGRWLPHRLRVSLYVFALHEGYLERGSWIFLWSPLDRLGALAQRTVGFGVGRWMAAAVPFSLGVFFFHPDLRSEWAEVALSIATLGAALAAFTERASGKRVWNGVTLSAFLSVGVIGATGTHAVNDGLLYLSAIAPAWLLGLWALSRLPPSVIDIRQHHGLVDRGNPGGRPFFLASLIMMGFPVSQAFLGEDLLLHHAAGHDLWISVVITLTYVLNGVSVLRLYSRIWLGPQQDLPAETKTAA